MFFNEEFLVNIIQVADSLEVHSDGGTSTTAWVGECPGLDACLDSRNGIANLMFSPRRDASPSSSQNLSRRIVT